MALPVPETQIVRVLDTEMQERFGQYVYAKRHIIIRVGNVIGQQPEAVMLAALDMPAVPKTGDKLNDEFPRLCAFQRTPKIVGWVNGKAIVKLAIEYALEEPTKGYFFRGTANLGQIRTHRDKNGAIIKVPYGPADYPLTVNAFAAEETEVRITVELTDDPTAERKKWIGKRNSDEWCGYPPKSWLVTRVEYELLNAEVSPNRYRFTWEMHRTAEPGGWGLWAIYRDSAHQIPPDATWTEIDWFDDIAYSDKFPWKGQPNRKA